VQVISPQQATGVVEVVEGLHLVQDKTYDTPTVLVAHQVRERLGSWQLADTANSLKPKGMSCQ
jgi:hypothetical protein